jgi:hypothetical protein
MRMRGQRSLADDAECDGLSKRNERYSIQQTKNTMKRVTLVSVVVAISFQTGFA